MAQLSSFATTASNVSVNSAERRITISTEVVEIDGVLDPPTGFDDWGGWEIICQSSGGFRSTSGASGTLGGGKHSLKIVEKTNGHRFGGDNFSNNNGSNARFAGDGTNVLKYHNIVWIVETGDRSDFDIGRGTNNSGSAGPKCELSGVSLYQLTQAGQTAHFNHYSGQVSIRNHPEVGYGLRVENRTNGHAIEFSTAIQTGAVVEGLVVANVTATNNDGTPAGSAARVAVRLQDGVSANGTLTLSNLNTPNITDVDGSSDKTLVLIDPVGQPAITNNWGRHVNIEIRRTVPFTFTGATPAGETMHAINQNTNGQNATAVMNGATGSIQLRTQRTASSSALTFTDYHDYRFFMTGLGFRKYALNTNTEITNTPATITAALTPDTLPDGTAISTIPQTNAGNLPDNLPEILRHIKDHEVDNPVHSAYPVTESLAYVDGTSVKINDDYRVIMSSSNTTPLWNIGEISGNDTIQFRTAASIAAGTGGLTTLEASGTGETITATNVTEGDGVFFKDSTGQRSVISVTNSMGANVLFSLVNSADGSTTGSSTINSASTGSFSITTKGLGTGYKLVGKRVGYDYFTTDVNLTGGGIREITAPAQRQIVQPDGSASYNTTITVPDTLTIAVSHSGTTPASRIECGNDTFTARQVFKAWEDEIATADGASYMGLGGAQITYTLSALKGNEIVLGAHTKVKRKATTDVNATIRATLYSPDDAPVDDSNGDVMTIEGLDVPAVAAEIWKRDLSGTQPDNSAGDLLKDASTNSGGGGGGATAQQIWEYSNRSLSTPPPTASAIATAVSGELTIPTAAQNATAVWIADDRELTTSAAPSVAAIRQGVIEHDLIGDPPTISPIQVNSTIMVLSQADYNARDKSNPQAVTFDNTGGYTSINTTTTYYAIAEIFGGVRFYWLYDTEANARTNNKSTGLISVTGGTGVATDIVISIDSEASRLGSVKDLLASIDGKPDAPTSAQNATAVAGALTIPSVSQIVEGVWAEIVDGGITTDLTITPEAESGDGFSIPADDAALISNGDAFQFTNTGGYSNISTTETYYAYVSNNVLYVYGSKHNALTPGAAWIQPSGGTIGDVRIVFVGLRPIGTAGVALHRILSAVVELDNDHDVHSTVTSQMYNALATLLGTNWVETGLSLKEAMQIIVAINAGKASRSGDQTTFHRLDSAETAVIRADANADGRTSPTRNPT